MKPQTPLTIALSRIDVRKEKHTLSSKAESPANSESVAFHFQNTRVGGAFMYEAQTTEFRFRGKADQSVKLQKLNPAGSKWEEKRMLLGQELRWGENSAGISWATYGDRAPAFVSSIVDGRGITLAIMLAMTYKPDAS